MFLLGISFIWHTIFMMMNYSMTFYGVCGVFSALFSHTCRIWLILIHVHQVAYKNTLPNRQCKYLWYKSWCHSNNIFFHRKSQILRKMPKRSILHRHPLPDTKHAELLSSWPASSWPHSSLRYWNHLASLECPYLEPRSDMSPDCSLASR